MLLNLRTAALAILLMGVGATSVRASLLFTTNPGDWAASGPGAITDRYSAFVGASYVDGFISATGPSHYDRNNWLDILLISASESGATGITGAIEQLNSSLALERYYTLTAVQKDGAVTMKTVVNRPGQLTFFGFTSNDDPITILEIAPAPVPEPAPMLMLALGISAIFAAHRVRSRT